MFVYIRAKIALGKFEQAKKTTFKIVAGKRTEHSLTGLKQGWRGLQAEIGGILGHRCLRIGLT